MRLLRRFVQLSSGNRLLLFEAVCLLSAVKLGLGLLPFRVLKRLTAKLANPSRLDTSQRVSIQDIVWAVEAATWHLPGRAKCLARALTTQVLMGRHGYPSELRIGVAKDDAGRLEAHAWLEHDGELVIGGMRGLSKFVPLPSLEGECE